MPPEAGARRDAFRSMTRRDSISRSNAARVCGCTPAAVPRNETYQPCAVTVVATGDVQRDVRVVNDYDVIGAAIPPAFLERTRTLSGVVYETIAGVGRQPVPFATVSIGGFRDWNRDLGWPIANTRTDAEGRYIICGLETEPSTSLYVINPIHRMFESTVQLGGDTVLDIELTATGAHVRAPSTAARRDPQVKGRVMR